jgi:hypothetical protein
MDPGNSAGLKEAIAVRGGPKQLDVGVAGNGEIRFPCQSEANWGAVAQGLRKPFTVADDPPSVKNRGVLGVEISAS